MNQQPRTSYQHGTSFLLPARCKQTLCTMGACTIYIYLLSKLTEHFDAVVGLLSSAISTQKWMAKRKCLKECGGYSEFFSGDARGVRPQASVAVAWWVMTWVCSRQASVGFAWWVSCRHPSASCVVCGWVTMPSCVATPLGAREMCSSGWIPLIAYAWRFIRDLPLSMKSCLGEPMLSSGGLRSGKQNGRHLNPRGCPKDSCLRVCPNGLLTCVPLEDC